MSQILKGCLALSLALAIPTHGGAQSVEETITSYNRPTIPLRESITQPPIHRSRSELPVPARITGSEGDFVRFFDPATGRSWLVSRFDVVIGTPSRSQSVMRSGPCLQSGAMGMGRRC